MKISLEEYRKQRNAARDKLREQREQISEMILATDLLWREKYQLLTDAWSTSIETTLSRSAPAYLPGMHHSSWQGSSSEEGYQSRCKNFVESMDAVLKGFPAPASSAAKRPRKRRPSRRKAAPIR